MPNPSNSWGSLKWDDLESPTITGSWELEDSRIMRVAHGYETVTYIRVRNSDLDEATGSVIRAYYASKRPQDGHPIRLVSVITSNAGYAKARKLGFWKCLYASHENLISGQGANTIADSLGLRTSSGAINTRGADALCNAGHATGLIDRLYDRETRA